MYAPVYCKTGVYKITDCGYSLEPPLRCGSNEYPQFVLTYIVGIR